MKGRYSEHFIPLPHFDKIENIQIFHRGRIRAQVLARQLGDLEGANRIEFYIFDFKIFRLFIPQRYGEIWKIEIGKCYEFSNIYRLDEHILLFDPWCKIQLSTGRVAKIPYRCCIFFQKPPFVEIFGFY